MQILAIDTASPRPAVSLLAGDALFEETLPSDRRSSEELLPAIARVLAAAGIRLADCERLAVCSGPGSFTGVRIGLATAWGLSRASGITVEAVSTLECLAESVREGRAGQRIVAVLDAGRGEVVVERFVLAVTRARSLSPAARLPGSSVFAFAAGDPLVALPAEFVEGALAPSVLLSTALVLAVNRAPGAATNAPISASYSRQSAAEEKHGAA